MSGLGFRAWGHGIFGFRGLPRPPNINMWNTGHLTAFKGFGHDLTFQVQLKHIHGLGVGVGIRSPILEPYKHIGL